MYFLSGALAMLGLLALSSGGSVDDDGGYHDTSIPDLPDHGSSAIHDPTCAGDVTFTDTTTIFSSTTVPITHFVNITQSNYVNVTVTRTETTTLSMTESTTNTRQFNVSVTETDLDTVTNTRTATASTTTTRLFNASTTKTDWDTITDTRTISELTTTTRQFNVSVTKTDEDTITNTQTTTETVPATITTYTTQTITSTSVDPCPDACSVSAGTVDLAFWPSNRPYGYPSTYVNADWDYTFVSPSVYMIIPTAQGMGSAGPTGPSTQNWIIPLDVEEVSTIVGGTETRQITLADLGTDCPRTAEPSAIATMVDSRCDPILAAPKQVSSWASPCNACGRFGLFDPPYAVPTLTGGILGTDAPETTLVEVTETTQVEATEPIDTEAPPEQTPSSPGGGVLLVVTYQDGGAMGTATMTTDGVEGTVISTTVLSATDAASSAPSTEATSQQEDTTTAPGTEATSQQEDTNTAPLVGSTSAQSSLTEDTPTDSPPSVPTETTSSPTEVPTGAATKATTGAVNILFPLFISALLL